MAGFKRVRLELFGTEFLLLILDNGDFLGLLHCRLIGLNSLFVVVVLVVLEVVFILGVVLAFEDILSFLYRLGADFNVAVLVLVNGVVFKAFLFEIELSLMFLLLLILQQLLLLLLLSHGENYRLSHVKSRFDRTKVVDVCVVGF